jgi:hypothetical protein
MFHILYPRMSLLFLVRGPEKVHLISMDFFGGYFLVCMVDIFGRLYVCFSYVINQHKTIYVIQTSIINNHFCITQIMYVTGHAKPLNEEQDTSYFFNFT